MGKVLKVLPEENRLREFIYRKIHSSASRNKFLNFIVLLILLSGAVILLFPLVWMLMTSVKTMSEIMQYPPSFFPENIELHNFVETWHRANFTRYTLNTLFLCAVGVTANVLSNSFIAYGFAKLDFPGKKILFALVLSLLMIPGFLLLVPRYILFTKLGWIDTYYPLLVPGFFGSSFFIFLLRQFYRTIPDDVIESAIIDGASHFYIWYKIALPIGKPALATVAIFAFKGQWNDFVGPLLYLNTEALYTVQLGLYAFQGQVHTQWNYLMAGSLIVLIPVLVVFFLFQDMFIEGMDIAGGKG